MSRAEAAVRRAGALVALAAVSALSSAPASSESWHGSLALHFVMLLGCAAVFLAPAHRAVAEPSRPAAEAAREVLRAPARSAATLRWAGFTCVTLYAAADTAEVPVDDKVNVFILFLVFLAGVWTVTLSLLTATERGPRPAAAEEEAEHDGGEVSGSTP